MATEATCADFLSAIANLATLGITGFTAWFGIRIFKHQRTSADIQLALGIFASINFYWDRITDTDGEHYQYDMGQILAQFEMAARLFNDSILTKDALPILKDHIIEVYTNVQSTDDGRAFIQNCVSSPTTFEDLRKFLRAHLPTALLAQQFANEQTN